MPDPNTYEATFTARTFAEAHLEARRLCDSFFGEQAYNYEISAKRNLSDLDAEMKTYVTVTAVAT